MTLLLLAAIALQPPGVFHEGEAIARDKQEWLALRVSKQEAALVPTRVTVKKTLDEIVGEELPTADDVSSTVQDVTMYLRGAPFSAGPVTMGRVTQPDDTSYDFRISFAGQDYRIAPRCRAAGEREGQRQLAFEWRLIAGAREQVLVRMPGYVDETTGRQVLGDDAAPGVLFVGDLDHDGKLDLILDATDHYNVSRPTLYLSKDAEDGDFVKQAAQFVSVGC